MSTITQIVNAIVAALEPLTAIDSVAINNYQPAVTTQSVALVIPPMGMRGTVNAPAGRKTRLTHRIPCEFYVKVNTGDLERTMQLGREICLDAAAELQATQEVGSALGGLIEFFGDGSDTPPFDWAVEDNVLGINQVAFIRATLFVTVTEWVVLTP